MVQPPPGIEVPFKPVFKGGGEGQQDWYPAVSSYMEQRGYARLNHSLPVGCGTTVAEAIRPGTKFELREAAHPARFWGVTVVEQAGGGGSGLLGLGYDSPELKPRTVDLRLFYTDPRLCPVGTVAASGGRFEFQVRSQLLVTIRYLLKGFCGF